MAIQWGSASGHSAVGIDLSYVLIDGGARARITAKYYVRSFEWGHNWTYPMNRGGAVQGPVNVSFYSPTGGSVTSHVHTAEAVRDLHYHEAQTHHFTADIAHAFGHPSVNARVTIPRRMEVPPRPPKNAKAVWTADGRTTITWSVDADAPGTAQPWRKLAVERYMGSTRQWTRIANLPATSTSYVDSTAPLNEHTEYQVIAGNDGGWSSPAWAGTVNTRPAPPTGVAAQRVQGGIEITWKPANNPVAGYIIRWEIAENGVKVGEVRDPNATSWVHLNPPTDKPHVYVVTAVTDTTGGLWSSPSIPSNPVHVLAPPNAPEGVSPVGTTVQPGTTTVFWRHNPSDTTAQTSAEVRYRPQGGSWTTAKVSGATQTLSFSTVDEYYEWQVRTWGAFQAGQESGASPWSQVFGFRVSEAPIVRITRPTSGGEWPSNRLTVDWTYSQQKNVGQARAQAVLYRDGVRVETRTISDSSRRVVFDTLVESDTAYEVGVQVMSAHGAWSSEEKVAFAVKYPPPPTPILRISWDDKAGVHEIQIENPAAAGQQPEATANFLQRSVDGGETWETVLSEIPINGTVIDREGLSYGETLYRITAFSDLPSSVTAEYPFKTESLGMWLAGGDGFRKFVKLEWDPEHSEEGGLADQEFYWFSGRAKPVEMTGVGESNVWSINAAVLEDWTGLAEIKALRELRVLRAPFVFRDPCCGRIYVAVSNVSMRRNPTLEWQIGCKLTEVDY